MDDKYNEIINILKNEIDLKVYGIKYNEDLIKIIIDIYKLLSEGDIANITRLIEDFDIDEEKNYEN